MIVLISTWEFQWGSLYKNAQFLIHNSLAEATRPRISLNNLFVQFIKSTQFNLKHSGGDPPIAIDLRHKIFQCCQHNSTEIHLGTFVCALILIQCIEYQILWTNRAKWSANLFSKYLRRWPLTELYLSQSQDLRINSRQFKAQAKAAGQREPHKRFVINSGHIAGSAGEFWSQVSEFLDRRRVSAVVG